MLLCSRLRKVDLFPHAARDVVLSILLPEEPAGLVAGAVARSDLLHGQTAEFPEDGFDLRRGCAAQVKSPHH